MERSINMLKILIIVLTAIGFAVGGVATAVAVSGMPDGSGDVLPLTQALRQPLTQTWQRTLGELPALQPTEAAPAEPAAAIEIDIQEKLELHCDQFASRSHPLLERLAEEYQLSYEAFVEQLCRGDFDGMLPPDLTVFPWTSLFPHGWTGFFSGTPDEWELIPPMEGEFPDPCNGPFADEKARFIADQLLAASGIDVTQQQVLDLLCQGYTAPEIVASYLISKQTGAPVEEVLALRNEGKTWREILEHYNVIDLPEREALPQLEDRPLERLLDRLNLPEGVKLPDLPRRRPADVWPPRLNP
jgi:hypothetical protein